MKSGDLHAAVGDRAESWTFRKFPNGNKLRASSATLIYVVNEAT